MTPGSFPFNPENKEAKNVLRRVRERIRSSADLSLTHYEDEDSNRVNSLCLSGYHFLTAENRLSLSYGLRSASDPDLNNEAHRVEGRINSRISPVFSAYASLGGVLLERDLKDSKKPGCWGWRNHCPFGRGDLRCIDRP